MATEEHIDEETIRAAFYEEYSREYLDMLESKGTAQVSPTEVLWAGFARGYRAAIRES